MPNIGLVLLTDNVEGNEKIKIIYFQVFRPIKQSAESILFFKSIGGNANVVGNLTV